MSISAFFHYVIFLKYIERINSAVDNRKRTNQQENDANSNFIVYTHKKPSSAVENCGQGSTQDLCTPSNEERLCKDHCMSSHKQIKCIDTSEKLPRKELPYELNSNVNDDQLTQNLLKLFGFDLESIVISEETAEISLLPEQNVNANCKEHRSLPNVKPATTVQPNAFDQSQNDFCLEVTSNESMNAIDPMESMIQNALSELGESFDLPSPNQRVLGHDCGEDNASIGDQRSTRTDPMYPQIANEEFLTADEIFLPPNDDGQDTEHLLEIDNTHSTNLQQKTPNLCSADNCNFNILCFGVHDTVNARPKQLVCKKNQFRPQNGFREKRLKDLVPKSKIQYYFCYKIDLKIVTERLLDAKTKLMFFGDIKITIESKKVDGINIDSLIKGFKHEESIYTFLELLVIEDYSVREMQDLYALFIINNCLMYSDSLRCWVLRDSLWKAHVFMMEFYPFIVWKVELFNFEDEAKFTEIEKKKYKNNLKEELKLMCIILELYNTLDVVKEHNAHLKHLALINYHVSELRKTICSFLTSFRVADSATSLLYLANSISNTEIPQKNLERIKSIKLTKTSFLVAPNQIASPSIPTKFGKDIELEEDLTSLAPFLDLHELVMAKNIIFFLAFTVNSEKFETIIYRYETILSKENDKKKKYSSSQIVQNFLLSTNYKADAFETSLFDSLEFLRLIKSKKSIESIHCANEGKIDVVVQFKRVMEDLKGDRAYTANTRLVIFQIMILRVMRSNFQ